MRLPYGVGVLAQTPWAAFDARSALESGVRKIHIIDAAMPHALLLEIFTAEGIGTELRRAYIGFDGTMPGGFGYRVEADLANSGVDRYDIPAFLRKQAD